MFSLLPLPLSLSLTLSLLSLTTITSLPTNDTLTRSLLEKYSSEDNGLEKRQGSVNVGFPYGQEKVRGVNIGGWLVTEPWITPSLYDNLPSNIVDEYTFCQNQDKSVATAALQAHWNSFYTEDDFRQIAAAGLNHVRIPIGYWAYDISAGEPYIQGAADYLDKAIGWARNHGLKVMIDLHGAPGSQNGYDNSGQRGNANWATQSSYYSRTVRVIETLSLKYSDPQYYGVVTALELLNEPAGYLNANLLDTYANYARYDGYFTARFPFGTSQNSGLLIVFHDAFQAPDYWIGKFTYPKYGDYSLDTHIYQVFSQELVSMSEAQHLSTACASGGNIATAAAAAWPIVGEWSPARTDCAKSLNGRGVGARYDGSYPGSTYVGSCASFSGDGSGFSSAYKKFLGQFWAAQVQTYEKNGQGWLMWTWKAPNAAEWSYQAGLNGGWIPYDPTNWSAYTC